MTSHTGLVLSGGGARAAYQVGALCALADILGTERTPFSIITGASAGAINAMALAGRADDFQSATKQLWHTWGILTPERVYRTDARSLGAIAGRWLRELGGGGLFAGNINHLLDTAPLRAFLEEKLSPAAVERNLERGALRAVAVSATNYHSGLAVSFYAAAPGATPSIAPWRRSMRTSEQVGLRVDHVLASAAIPVFFPPVAVDGAFFGDGCVRLTAPLSPAIHLGAQRLIAIGVRAPGFAEHASERGRDHGPSPSLSEIGGVLLNAVFLDSLESDVERLERINRTLALIPPGPRAARAGLRDIPILVLRPSQDLGRLALHQHEHFPPALRYLLRGIGVTGAQGADLLSYLAFAPDYIGYLLELGRRDTMARRHDIERFFAACRPAVIRG